MTTNGEPQPRYREVWFMGHTILVRRTWWRWCWSVEYPDGSSIEGWTFGKRAAYRAVFNMVPT